MYFDEDAKRYYNMRYVDFQRGNPYVFRIDDKGLLNSRKEIFARKFDYVIDKDIIFNLRDRITNRKGDIYEQEKNWYYHISFFS